MTDDPHARGPVAQGGAPLSRAGLAMILVHGRGGSARDMLVLAERLALPNIACFAPEAAGNSWWPQSFLAPKLTGLRAPEDFSPSPFHMPVGPRTDLRVTRSTAHAVPHRRGVGVTFSCTQAHR